MISCDNVFFSIVVPIYNVEKYLPECIDSVLTQSYGNFELILVDDGSPDSSGKICDDYTAKDGRIRVLHKQNGGLSSARNAGIELSLGTYVIFLDSDDYWDDKQALENIHNRLVESEADVLVFPAKRFYEEKNQFTYIINVDIDRTKIISENTDDAIKYMIENNFYRAAAWNKVIKKSIIDAHNMLFLDGYLSEDMDWCGDLLLYAKRFDFYENPMYVYRQQRVGSITKNKSEKLVSDKLFMCKKGYEQAQKLEDKQKAELLASYYAYEYSVLLGVSGDVKNKALLAEIKKLSPLLEYDICSKVKKVNMMKKLIGYELTRRMLSFFVRIKR